MPAAVVGRGEAAPDGEFAKPIASLVETYCLDCHDSGTRKGDLSLEDLSPALAAAHPEAWERVVRKMAHRQMPPIGEPRPDNAEYDRVVSLLTAALDRGAAEMPNPGRTDTFRRLTRTEYQNAIRDVLALEVDASAWLPNDEPSHGFDNVTVGTLSPTLLERYVTAAQKIARLAVGAPARVPGGDTFRLRPDVTQEEHVDGLPLGTRGGGLFPYLFSQDGEYEIELRLARDRNEQVEGLRKPHQVEVLLDRERVALFTVKPPGADKNAESVDAHLKLRLGVTAGPHAVGVTFLKEPSLVLETERQPYQARFNMHRHPRTGPALYQVSITGPFNPKPAGDTPSRRAILGDLAGRTSNSGALGEAEARVVLAKLARRAYRRPISDDDLRKPLQFYREGSAEGGGFDGGIENAISAILVSPHFLFRIEEDRPAAGRGTAYRISDLELASRLSFFLWSSVPDEALLDAAERGELSRPPRLEQQVRRMLADPRSTSLVTNFASQWLQLRNLDAITPDLRKFIDFDDNLRQSFRRETELFCEHILHEDRPVTELLQAEYSFVNERLARHYGLPHIHGSHFRRVAFANDPARQRGGILRHGSVLTLTSYAIRTSPVIRGKWVLDTLLGTPPPPPAPDTPPLDRKEIISRSLTMRERLAAHRANPACASCHHLMDPIGFALENYDAIGRWRATEHGRPVDNSGGFTDGSEFAGISGLERALLARPELFVGALSEKLLTFALGRGVDYYDAPAIREIVRRAQAEDFRFSSVILGLVNSPPFQMRKSP